MYMFCSSGFIFLVLATAVPGNDQVQFNVWGSLFSVIQMLWLLVNRSIIDVQDW